MTQTLHIVGGGMAGSEAAWAAAKAGLEVVEDLNGKEMSEKYMTRSNGKLDGVAGDHWGLMHARVPKR